MGFLDSAFNFVTDNLGSIGTAVGNYFGGPVGGAIGGSLGGLFEDDPSFPMGMDGGSGLFGSLISGVGSLFKDVTAKDVFSGLFSAGSAAMPYFLTKEAQDRANETNVMLARENRQFQTDAMLHQNAFNRESQNIQTMNTWGALNQQDALARELMDKNLGFQERMANTQWQRGVEDMKRAGLSPMLAYMKGGAHSPSGGGVGVPGAPGYASASSGLPSGSVAQVENSVARGFQSAGAILSLENAKAQNELLRAQAIETLSRSGLNVANTGLSGAREEWTRTDRQRLWAEIDRVFEQVGLTNAQTQVAKAQIRTEINRGNELAVRHILQELKIPEAFIMARSLMDAEGKPTARAGYLPYLRDIESGVSSAGALARIPRAIFGGR